MAPISARPPEAADRAVSGHWGGRSAARRGRQGRRHHSGRAGQQVRAAGAAADTRKALDLRAALTPMIASLPDQLRRTLTWDQGKETAEHAQIAIAADIKIFLCDPHSPWRRGSNENTNGLLRQYWAKGSDLRGLTQTDCDEVALRLNTRPRQTLGWKTPQQALDEALCATAA